MDFATKQRIRQYWPWALATLAIALLGTLLTLALFAAPPNVTVDFTKATTTLAPHAFSGTISTYGNQGTIVNSAKQRTNLANLSLGSYRIPLQYNNGNPVSSAEGAAGGPSGDTWIAKIREIGAEPMIVLGGTQDNNFTAQDAAGMVRHYSGAKKVTYWVIGNEPDNRGIGMAEYCTKFNEAAKAMKAVDPNIKVIGPALTDYETYKYADYDQFLECAGGIVDIVDFHDYGERTQDLGTNISEQAERYEGKIQNLRERIQRIVPGRASQIGIQVGEWNLTPVAGGDLDPRMYSGGTTVFGALAAGSIAKGGARGHQYSDQNNPLGLTFETAGIAANFGRTVADPMPLYHGVGMFTGEGLFRSFGSKMVQATSDNPNISVFASDNKNVVLVNKNETSAQTAVVDLVGFNGGTAEIWQTDKNAPFDPPTHKETINVTDLVEVTLPAWTVTTIVLTEGSTAPAGDAGPEAPTPTEPTPADPTPDPTPDPAPATNTTEVPVRINVGGGEYTDPSGDVWAGDFGSTGGNTDNQAAGRTIKNTNKPQIYQDERWGNFSYRIPVAKGTYKVRLHFAEIYSACPNIGCRVFNVSAEGDAWLSNFDIVAEAGANAALVKEKTITLDDNALELVFAGIVGSPQLAAIEVLSADAAAPSSSADTGAGGTPSQNTGGLSATYFPNISLSGTGTTRTDANIDFNWGTSSPMSGIPANQFSVRWAGTITAPTTGSYTFYLTGDDGVRMWINDQQIINGWRDQSSREYSARVSLTAGVPNTVRIEYYDNYVDAVARLAWSGPTTGKQIVPASAFNTASSGLNVTYYQYNGDGKFGNAILTTTSPTIDYNVGSGSPHESVPNDRFGATWSGKVTAPVSGEYTFGTDSDDGVRVWVNGQRIINNWTDHSNTRNNGKISLTAGQKYDIKVSYYENYGDSVMRLLWKTPGQNTFYITPSSALSH